MKKFRFGSLFFVILGQCVAAESGHLHPMSTNEAALTPDYINQLAEEMRTNHPALRAADARATAAHANTNSIRLFEDPMLKLGGSVYDQRGGDPRMEGNLIYGVEQRLPVFGKPQAARRAAMAEAETEEARSVYAFQTMRRDLAQALFRAALAERVLEVGHEDLAWLDTLAKATEERYRAGTASQFEVLRVLNERSKRVTALETDAKKRDNATVSVNLLIGRTNATVWPVLRLPPIAEPVVYSSSLVELALRNEPRLSVLRAEITQAKAMVDVTRRSRYPEVGLGVEGRQYSGDGGFREGMFTLNLSLPWFNGRKYKQDLARDQAKLDATRNDAAAYELAVKEEIHHLLVAVDASRREAVLYRDEVIPRSQQALASAQNAWLSGRGTSTDVMEARRMLLDAQITHDQAVAEQYIRLSEIILCCGLGDLDALQMLGEKPPGKSTN